ncbi:hypothetical protein EG359_06165 [Chryseobacterium joostei]|uniref:Uncharacterized protein n=1 Tax=Chryseobacterium joostei TaxID=112234 RepID=A0A1N7HST9_9FLAO|nr:hypothetical protein EG359_06165 [Chryseobacterium joostei]RXM63163.1 hypothetical protein BOQ60_17620 [Chryseobacterium sp. CH1]SIS27944.1 hypothetical protein SAMN05421768_101126 [Chryseobacterium joostei]
MIKITLPSSDAIKAINDAKEDCLQPIGFFIKYKVTFNKLTMEIEPNAGFEYDPSDIFHLAWYAREYK